MNLTVEWGQLYVTLLKSYISYFWPFYPCAFLNPAVCLLHVPGDQGGIFSDLCFFAISRAASLSLR